MKQIILFSALFLFGIRFLFATDLQPTPGITIEDITFEGKKICKINITARPHKIWKNYLYVYDNLIAPEIVLTKGQKKNLRVHTSYSSKDLTFSLKKNFSSIFRVINISEELPTKEEEKKIGVEPIIDWEGIEDDSEGEYCKKWIAALVGEVTLDFSLMIEEYSLFWPVTLKVPIRIIEKEHPNEVPNEP